jgi:hypothetical protein
LGLDIHSALSAGDTLRLKIHSALGLEIYLALGLKIRWALRPGDTLGLYQ